MHAHPPGAARRWTYRALFLSLTLAAFPVPAAAQLPGARTTMDGVYTDEQADAGAKTYEAICSTCHGTGLPLKGPSFLKKWSDQSLYRLWEYMSTRMPYGAPGTLAGEEYLGMLAWVLRENGYPAGDTPLPDTNANGIYFEIAPIFLAPRPDTP